MFQLAQNGSCAYTHRSKFLFDFPRTIHPIWMSCTLSSFPGWQNLKKLNKTKSGTYSLGAISKIILGLHILLWRPEIRPRIALRLRANLVLLGRRRWKRFLEYWEGKTLENYFCAVVCQKFSFTGTLIKLTLSKCILCMKRLFFFN